MLRSKSTRIFRRMVPQELLRECARRQPGRDARTIVAIIELKAVVSAVRQLVLLVGLAFFPAIGQALFYRNSTIWQEQPPTDSALVSLAEAQSWGDKVLWL